MSANQLVGRRPRGRPPKRKRDSISPNTVGNNKNQKSSTSTTKSPPPKRQKRPLTIRQQLRQKPYSEEDDDDSDEEKSYQRSIKERMILAEAERREAEIAREKYEQKRINAMFFLQNRRSSDQQMKTYIRQQLINCDLFNPPEDFRPPKNDPEYKAFCEKPVPAPSMENTNKQVELAIPQFRDIEEQPDEWDPVITAKFLADYAAGLLRYSNGADEKPASPPSVRKSVRRSSRRRSSLFSYTSLLSSPSIKIREKRTRTSSTGSSSNKRNSQKVSQVPHLFHPARWTEAELQLFQELVLIYGREWGTISELMGNIKNSFQLKRTFHKAAGSWKSIRTIDLVGAICGVCNGGFNQPMVFCDGCDRAYHLTCTQPPLPEIPTEEDWFCSIECSQVAQAKCELCGSGTDDANMLLCDKCNKGYHIYCLPVPLSAIPDGDWFCDTCIVAGQNGRIVEKHSSVNTTTQITDCDSTNDKCDEELSNSLRIKCEHEWSCSPGAEKHRVFVQYQPPHDEVVKTTVASSKTILWKHLVALSRICAECMLHATGGTPVPPDLSKLAVEGSICADRFPETVTSLVPPTAEQQLVHAATLFTKHVDTMSIINHPINKQQLEAHFSAIIAAVENTVDKLVAQPVYQEGEPVVATKKPKKAPSRASNGRPKKRKTPHTSLRAGPPRRRSSSGGSADGNSKSSSSTISQEEFNREDGYSETENRYWIFQANPSLYDVVSSVRNLPDMTWFVKQHINRIRKGDKVFVWEAGKDAGVIATGVVKSDPENMAEARGMKQFCLVSNLFDTVQLRCWLHIDKVIPDKIRKADLKNHPVLSNLTILRAPIGTNFRITKAQGLEIEQLVEKMMSRGGGIIHPSSSPERDTNANVGDDEEVDIVTVDEPVAAAPSDHITIQPDDISHSSDNQNTSLFIQSHNTEQLSQSEEQQCCVCSNAVSPNEFSEMLRCESCASFYHRSCLITPDPKPMQELWICDNCNMDTVMFKNLQQVMVIREIRYEASRLCKCKAEHLLRQHRSNVQTLSEPTDVHEKMKILTEELKEAKRIIIDVANNAFNTWHEKFNTRPIQSAAQ